MQPVCSLVSIYFDSPQRAYNKNKLYKTLGYWSWDMLKSEILEKGLGIVSPPHFVYDFWKKMFLMVYSINWPNFIVWLPSLLEILGNIRIAILRFPGFDVFFFFNQVIFLHGQKVKTKFWISWERKEVLRWNKKHFSSFLKAFQLPKIASDVRVRL